MIRFVDIRGQGTGHRFAFWDTCYDCFCTFHGEQAWDDEADFVEAFEVQGGTYCDPVKVSDVERFTGLMPEWASEPMSDDDEL
jgi:hypothetical protein